MQSNEYIHNKQNYAIKKLNEGYDAFYAKPPSINKLQKSLDYNYFTPAKYAINFNKLITKLFLDKNIQLYSVAKYIEGDYLGGNFPKNYTAEEFFPQKKIHYTKYDNKEVEDFDNLYKFSTLGLFDFDFIVENGLEKAILLLESSKNKCNKEESTHQNKLLNIDASISICKTIIDLSENLYYQYSIQAKQTTDKKTKQDVYDIANNCLQVPYLGANNLKQALQSIWIINLTFLITGITPSFGRLDKTLQQYINKENNKEYCLNLLQSFFIKHSSYFKSYQKYEKVMGRISHSIIRNPNTREEQNVFIKNQNVKTTITVGGSLYLEDENFNQSTELILDAYNLIKPNNLRLFIRINQNTNKQILNKIADYQKNNLANIFIVNEQNHLNYSNTKLNFFDNNNTNSQSCKERYYDFAFDSLAAPLLNGNYLRIASSINLKEIITQFLFKNIILENRFSENTFGYNKKFLSPLLNTIKDELLIKIRAIIKNIPEDISVLQHPHINTCYKYQTDEPLNLLLSLNIDLIPETVNIISAIKSWCFDHNIININSLTKEILATSKENLSSRERKMVAYETRTFGSSEKDIDNIFGQIISTISKALEQWHIENNSSQNNNYHLFTEANINTYPCNEILNGVSVNIQSSNKTNMGISAILKPLSEVNFSEFLGGIWSNIPLKEEMIDSKIINEIINQTIHHNGYILNIYKTKAKGLNKILLDLSKIIDRN